MLGMSEVRADPGLFDEHVDVVLNGVELGFDFLYRHLTAEPGSAMHNATPHRGHASLTSEPRPARSGRQ